MKKIYLVSAMFLIALSINAQRVFNAAASQTSTTQTVKQEDPMKEYLRPSLTTIYINRGGELNERLINQMIENGISGKFNDNSIDDKILIVNGAISEADLHNELEAYATKQLMRRWFPSFIDSIPDDKGWSMEVVHSRGMYNATDADVISAKASNLKEALLKDKGMDLIERSYIVVYDIYHVAQIKEDDKEGYEAGINVFLYQLDWSAAKEAFFEKWTSPDAIETTHFPLKHIASFIEKSNLTPVKVSQSSNQGSFLRLSEPALFKALSKQVEKMADVYLTQASEDFKVKAPIFAVSPVRAKIGTKEGVTVDQRYFVYEKYMNMGGEEALRRKGVVRATSSIVKNDTMATGQGGTTKFYQTYGKNLREGMMLKQSPDWGTGVSLLGGTDVGVLVELNAGLWLGKYVPALQNLKVPYGCKIYVKYLYPLATMEIEGLKLVDENNKELTFETLSFGIAKDFYFAHYFSVTPYLGFSSLMVPKKYGGDSGSSGFDIGLNGSMGILHNAQIVGNLGWNTVKADWYATGLNFMVGGRYQF